MNQKITVKIDVSKIDKTKIVSRTWTDKEGQSRTVKELVLDIVPLNETKLLKDGDTYQLFKTHFVAEQQTKQEREAKSRSKIIGEGTMFVNKEKPKEIVEEDIFGAPEAADEDIPFL